MITLDEAYWWLNNNNGSYARPLIRELSDQVSKSEDSQQTEIALESCQRLMDTYGNYLQPVVRKLVDQLQSALKFGDPKAVKDFCNQLHDSGGSYLRPFACTLVLQMRTAVEENKDPRYASLLLERLKDVSGKLTVELEAGEVLVECGVAACNLNNLEEAVRLFRMAIIKYSTYWHQHAVAQWMMGHVLWLNGQPDQAMIAWERSLEKFEKLGTRRAPTPGASTKWYQEKIEIMNQSLAHAIKNNGISQPKSEPTPVPTSPMRPKTEAESQTPASVGDLLAFTYTTDYTLFNIYDSIPAGGLAAVGVDPNFMGLVKIAQVTIEQVMIDERPYRVINLRDGHIVNVSGNKTYITVKVKGNSMNKARPVKIEDGDYILLKQQNIADNGDIIAAEVVNEDSSATLKRFSRRGSKIILGAESNDPQFKNKKWEFTMPGEGFNIRGVALAVFKPIQ
jgi:tetratricopeptide (TPR) repeat protein